MFDLIGYWSAVTFYSAFLISIPLAVFYTLAGMVVTGAIPDAKDKDKVSRWFYTHEYDSSCNHWVLFGGRADLPCCIFITILILSLCLWLGVCCEFGDHNAESLVQIVKDWSAGSINFMTWIGITTVTMLLIRIATKYVYKAVKISEKVKSHIDNTKIHTEGEHDLN